MLVGVIGYQGDVSEHIEMLHRLRDEYKREVSPVKIKSLKDLNKISALIIPGGESTTIYKLIKEYGLYRNIIKRARLGMPVMGTCAGIIILSRSTGDSMVMGMNLLNISIERNAYGRQINSFRDYLNIKNIGRFEGVFIRAPVIDHVGDGVDILATYEGSPVMVRSGKILGLTFHPELTNSTLIHDYFLSFVEGEGYISSRNREWYVRDVI